MRLSTRLLGNATTTYLRLGTTLVIGLFSTWYILGAVGIVGFGLIALAISGAGPSHALERALRFGLVRELAAAIAAGDPALIRRSMASAFRLCLQATAPLAIYVALLAALAWYGAFNLPRDQPDLKLALVALILGEGVHAAIRLLSAPYLQSLFAAQKVGIDNLLMVVARSTYALSAVAVFGWLLPDAGLTAKLTGFAATRATFQLVDVVLGIWLAKRFVPGVRLDRSAYDETEYRSVRSTVWQSAQVSLLLNINPQLLAILINLFFGLTYNTIWQIVVQFSGYAWMLAEGLLRGIEPLTTRLERNGRIRAVIDLMARSIRYQLAIALPAAILLGLFARPLLELWVGRRLAADDNLAAVGIPVSQALQLAAAMASILLAVQALRAGFYGVERVLYGMGQVRSYAWFSKWTTLITLGAGAVLMALVRQPIVAPIVMLFSYALYSPVTVLRAAHRVSGLEIGAALRRSLPRPLAAALAFVAILTPIRLALDGLTPVSLAALIAGSAIVYGLIASLLVPTPDERNRLAQLLRQGVRWIRRRAVSQRGGS